MARAECILCLINMNGFKLDSDLCEYIDNKHNNIIQFVPYIGKNRVYGWVERGILRAQSIFHCIIA